MIIKGFGKTRGKCSSGCRGGGLSPLLLQGSWHLGSGGELLDGTVVILCGKSLQGAPAVSVQFDDLHEERASQLGLGRTEHLVPDGRQELRHHLWELLFQETPHALQLEERRGEGGGQRRGV